MQESSIRSLNLTNRRDQNQLITTTIRMEGIKEAGSKRPLEGSRSTLIVLFTVGKSSLRTLLLIENRLALRPENMPLNKAIQIISKCGRHHKQSNLPIKTE